MTDSRIAVIYAGVIDPINPDPEKIKIETIAHSLSNQCRYTGHIVPFYSVAQHSVLASRIVPRQYAYAALMHDASEAYLLDVPSPLKNALFGKQYREVEDRLMEVISAKFEFEWPMPKEVVYADNALLRTEVRDLMPQDLSPEDFEDLWGQWFFAEPLEEKIEPWSPEVARTAFMVRYHELRGI